MDRALFKVDRSLILGAILLLLGACSSTQVQITSNPSGAEVWVKPLGSGVEKQLGVTPINFDPQELDGVPSSSGPLSVVMKKDGYREVDLLVADIGSADMEIHKDLVAGPGFENPSKLNAHIERLFLSQQLIQQGRLADAKKILENVREAAPTLAVVHEMLGGIYFLEEDRANALASFKKALALNPTSADAVNMTRELAGAAEQEPEVAQDLLGGETE